LSATEASRIRGWTGEGYGASAWEKSVQKLYRKTVCTDFRDTPRTLVISLYKLKKTPIIWLF